MAARRLILISIVWFAGWLPADAQTVRGRYTDKGKRPAPRTAVAHVSICESAKAYAYHSGMCRGLARCTHGVSQVSVAQAQRKGYVPCKICY